MISKYETKIIEALEKVFPHATVVSEIVVYVQSPFSWMNGRLFKEYHAKEDRYYFMIANPNGEYLFYYKGFWSVIPLDPHNPQKLYGVKNDYVIIDMGTRFGDALLYINCDEDNCLVSGSIDPDQYNYSERRKGKPLNEVIDYDHIPSIRPGDELTEEDIKCYPEMNILKNFIDYFQDYVNIDRWADVLYRGTKFCNGIRIQQRVEKRPQGSLVFSQQAHIDGQTSYTRGYVVKWDHLSLHDGFIPDAECIAYVENKIASSVNLIREASEELFADEDEKMDDNENLKLPISDLDFMENCGSLFGISSRSRKRKRKRVQNEDVGTQKKKKGDIELDSVNVEKLLDEGVNYFNTFSEDSLYNITDVGEIQVLSRDGKSTLISAVEESLSF